MSYSIVDFYIINLPIFVPSIEYLIKNELVTDRTIYSHYCTNEEKLNKAEYTGKYPTYYTLKINL